MSKINVSQWKKFKLSSMFDVCYGSFVPKKDRGTRTPFITTSSENNGISYYVDSDPMFKGDALTVASDGSVGATFYHDKPFSAGNIAVVLEPHDDVRAKWTPKSALFIATCIRKYAQIRHSWTDKYSVNRVRDTMLPLPVDFSGKPDWQYMDEYIAKLATQAHTNISLLRQQQKKAPTVNIDRWKEFSLSYLFHAEFTDGDNKPNRLLEDDDGHPLIGATSKCFGCVGYYQTDTKVFPAKSLTWDRFGHCFVQPKSFQTMAHGNVMVLKPKVDHSYEALLFVASIINRISQMRDYGYGRTLTLAEFKRSTIKLPALSDGTPDWATMRKRVADLVALSHRNVTSLDPSELPIFVGDWQEFHLYDFFDIESGSKLDKRKAQLYEGPDFNLIGRSVDHNGIVGHCSTISGIKSYKKGCLTIPLGGRYLGACYVQLDDFYTTQNVDVLIPKFDMSDYVKKFISIVVFRESQLHYEAFVNELNRHIKTDFAIKLPVDLFGHPDWQYMDKYISSIQQAQKKRVARLTSIVK